MTIIMMLLQPYPDFCVGVIFAIRAERRITTNLHTYVRKCVSYVEAMVALKEMATGCVMNVTAGLKVKPVTIDTRNRSVARDPCVRE